jgi:hypothetical protein
MAHKTFIKTYAVQFLFGLGNIKANLLRTTSPTDRRTGFRPPNRQYRLYPGGGEIGVYHGTENNRS